jgi:hypothetical protein
MTKKILFRLERPEAVYEQYPIPASTAIPDWFKEIKPEVNSVRSSIRNRGTVKKCVPFLDALTTGYFMVLGHDVEIKSYSDGNKMVYWGVDETRSSFKLDDPHRMEGLIPPAGYFPRVWRVDLPHSVETPPGYSVLLTHPFNRYELPFLTLSGVIDTDKSFRSKTANIWLRDDFEGIIEKGTPMAQLLPFKRENWDHENLPYNKDLSAKRTFDITSVLNRSYQRNQWSKKRYN